jgi:hypothetical protein
MLKVTLILILCLYRTQAYMREDQVTLREKVCMRNLEIKHFSYLFYTVHT